jgi:hypothetical protein
MDETVRAMPVYDRSEDDLGNMVELGHVNLRVPHQIIATQFYISGLGLTRDPYMMTGTDNMWANVGRSQFHLPTGPAQRLNGVVGLVVPGIEHLLRRLASQGGPLAQTAFAVRETPEAIEVTCPWGNCFRCHPPGSQWGSMALGMPYVEFDAPAATAEGIARFYHEIIGAVAKVEEDSHGRFARIESGPGQALIFREGHGDASFDGHHIQVTFADFSGPHARLQARGLISEESNQHQYRFERIVDLDTGKGLFTVEHEVRSMAHPMYARPLVNRNPTQTARDYAPGHDALAWSLPPAGG